MYLAVFCLLYSSCRYMKGCPWKQAQLWYNYNKTIYPHLTRIDMYRIEGGVIGPCVSSVSEDGLGEDKLTLDDRLTGLLILIDDGIVDNIIKGFF